MIAHRIQTVMRADIILVLDKGRVIQHGSHKELMTQDGIYRKIYELQAKVEQEITDPDQVPVNGHNGKSTPVSSHSSDERSLT